MSVLDVPLLSYVTSGISGFVYLVERHNCKQVAKGMEGNVRGLI
jgi:hypothetical protein